MALRIGVLTFPGSNCDHDALFALRKFFHVDASLLWHRDSITDTFDMLVVPGGFSYGDYLRSGAIARFAPAMKSLTSYAGKGVPILGICNGFQILCEAGLLPGALIRNTTLKHIAKSVNIQAYENSFTTTLDKNVPYSIPVSHGDGNYRIDDDTLKKMQDQNQIAFRYTEDVNGSVFNIAGVTDKKQKILGMMPHPERSTDPINGKTDGALLLKSFLAVAGA